MLRFFQHPDVTQAIDTIASASRVTVFVGAGASAEIGLPMWEDLVNKLNRYAIAKSFDDAVVEELVKRSSSLAVLTRAELTEALIEELHANDPGQPSLQDLITQHLYSGTDPDHLTPGPLIREVARLYQSFNETLSIATTNYDPLIEFALRDVLGGSADVRSYRSRRRAPEGVAGVVHLHGYTHGAIPGGVVLTERDYYSMQLRRSWQEEYAIEALRGSTCIFVGTSLTDANLLRYLHGSSAAGPHFAFFTRPAPIERGGPSSEQVSWEEALRKRWQRVGVNPLFSDNYADVAQFLREVRRRRQLGDVYIPLPKRLCEWLTLSERQGVRLTDPEDYEELQRTLAIRLRELGVAVQTVLTARGYGIKSEVLQLGLFVVHEPMEPSDLSQQERALALATSDRIMLHADSNTPLPLVRDSQWVSVLALCDGKALAREVNTYASRWRFVRAVPVREASDEIPIGAVTLATTEPRAATVLDDLTRQDAYELDKLMADAGERILMLGLTDP